MKQKINIFFSGLCILFLGLIQMSHAQTTNEGQVLDSKQTAIVSIAALTASGNLNQLEIALNNGLDTGLTINEIKEVLIQMYAYAGFPRSLNGINTFSKVLERRQQQGIHDEVGQEPQAIPTDREKYEIGQEHLVLLTGVQPPATPRGYAAFVPTIDIFLKEHLFADIFSRGVLSYQTRELATIAALASLGNVNPQLQSHMNVGIYNGLTKPQLENLISIIRADIGAQEAENASTVLNQIFNQH